MRQVGWRRRDAALAMLSLAGRAGSHRLRRLFETGGPGFRDLAVTQAAGTAGDTLVALALAGTLFFAVPTAEARGNVALYLLLTVAPFAVIGPGLSALLERNPLAYRLSLVAAAALRGAAALSLVVIGDPLWLLPIAFVLLVLSRVHAISRNALLPVALDEPRQLVAANARLAWIGVLAGGLAVAPGLLAVRMAGPTGALLLATAAFAYATIAALRVPEPIDERARPRPRSTRPEAQVRRLLPRGVRLAQLATAGVRLLNGFLLLLLAFALRASDAGLLDFGAILAAAGAGFALAAAVSPALERRLREEPMVVAALAIEAAAAFVAAQWFGLLAAAALAGAAGFAWGAAKLAFDGLLQSAVPAHRRGAAFTRSETLFALAWVVGAIMPTAVPLPADVGLIVAGLAALAAQVVYVAHLLIDGRPDSPGPDPAG